MQPNRSSSGCRLVWDGQLTKLAKAWLALAWLLLATGCAQVGPEQQRLVSKPNMTFSDSLVFSYQNGLIPQVEPGSAFSGGAQSSGCTSCK